MNASRQFSELPDTPEQDRLIARINLIFGTVLSVIGFAWFLTQRTESYEWASPYLLGLFWLLLMVGCGFTAWVNRGKIQRAIEESDFF